MHDNLILEIKKVESEIIRLIGCDEKKQSQFSLITSIKGVGVITAVYMICTTNCFTLFDSWRKFASYAGTATFPYQPGISINGRTKVNHLANKKFKVLLNMSVRSAINYNNTTKDGKQKARMA